MAPILSRTDFNSKGLSDVVWPESKQIGLIDSIFRNFYIPPVIFAVAKDEFGEVVRICVDGKQRLTSIQKFLDGLVGTSLLIPLRLVSSHSN